MKFTTTSIVVLLALSAVATPADAVHLRHGQLERRHKVVVDNASELPTSRILEAADVAEPSVAVQTPIEVERIVDEEEYIISGQRVMPTKRAGTCIGPLCGLDLFFTLAWLTFGVCAVVVYLVDRCFNPFEPTIEKETPAPKASAPVQQRRQSGGPAIVRQATAYYQNVAAAAINSKLLRRRLLSWELPN